MSLESLALGTPQAFNVVIEIPKGSSLKYEYDEEQGAFLCDFVFSGGFGFIESYGYVPHTRGGDGDRLDVFVIAPQPFAQGAVVTCRAIGMIELLDRGVEDNKIIAVPTVDRFTTLRDMSDLSPSDSNAYREFFKQLAIQKQKSMEILAFHGHERAEQEIARCTEKLSG